MLWMVYASKQLLLLDFFVSYILLQLAFPFALPQDMQHLRKEFCLRVGVQECIIKVESKRLLKFKLERNAPYKVSIV